MKRKPTTYTGTVELRRRAEILLGKQKKKKKKNAQPRTDADTQRLLHELQVHQIELEMQNAELQDARDEVEAGLEKYTDLYDFAPVGYFSLDEQGQILKVNLTGAALLGIERSRLLKRRLSVFMAPTSRPIWLTFLEKVFNEPGRQLCEAEFRKEDGTPFWVDLQAEPVTVPMGVPRGCRLAVSDITPLKRAKEAQAHMEVLAAANRELTQEIKRRKAVEESLRKSEQHTKRLLSQSLKLQGQLRHLSHQVLKVQEEERKRISHDLHDDILQALAGVNVHLATLKKVVTANPKDLKRKITATQRLVERSMDSIHQYARELRPMLLDNLGLVPALRSYIEDVTKRTGLRIHFNSFTHSRVDDLDNDRRTVLYRVAQEAITNVVRHAHASRIEVDLQSLQGTIRLEIKDNGKAFQTIRVLSATKHKRLGLLCMRERVEMVGGTFTIESEPDQGTSIRVEIPYIDDMRS